MKFIQLDIEELDTKNWLAVVRYANKKHIVPVQFRQPVEINLDASRFRLFCFVDNQPVFGILIKKR